jgi:MoaA/NifB/PqqE/SkfB family radical SAM enzyme
MYDIDRLSADRPWTDRLRQSFAAASAPLEIRDAKIKITSRCNLRCAMCHYGSRGAEESLGTAQWCRVLDELRALGCAKVHLSGGEPFLRPDLLDIVRHATTLGLKTNLTTNGTLLDKSRARQLVRARPSGVSISLDAPTAGAHDAIRGQAGAFRRSVRAIELLRDARHARRRKPEIRINVVVMKDNYRRLPELATLAFELGADDVVLMPVDETGACRRRLSGRQILRFNQEIAPRLLELREQRGLDSRPERVFVFGTTERDVKYAKRGLYARGLYQRSPCFAPWLHLFAAWDGQLYPCCMTNELCPPLGNVRDRPLAELWGADAYGQLRRRFAAGDPLRLCHRCDLFTRENVRLARALDLDDER